MYKSVCMHTPFVLCHVLRFNKNVTMKKRRVWMIKNKLKINDSKTKYDI